MGNDFRKERRFVASQADSFMKYLHEEVLTEKAANLLKEVASQTDVYIFSGIIRNFLLGFTENRDVDVVVTEMGKLSFPYSLLRGCKIEMNGFGGYKLFIDNLSVDAWSIASTWGLQRERLKPTPFSLIKTAFFNFSAIAYDYNNKRFIFDESVCQFLRNNFMDVVYPVNPDAALCILNTAYYARKYKFPIAYQLCRWMKKHYSKELHFTETQERHFHKQLISTDALLWMMKSVDEALNERKMKKGQGLVLDFVQQRSTIVNESDIIGEVYNGVFDK